MDQDDLKKYSVIIENGSGCVFQPMTDEYTYILTAKHLFIDEIENKRGKKLKVEKSNGSKINIRYLTCREENNWKEVYIRFILNKNENYFPHNTADIAILKIKFIAGFDIIQIDEVIEHKKDYKLCGYPENFRNNNSDGYTSYKVDGFLDSKNNYHGAQIDSTLTHENINGMSGGGMLCLNENHISIIGIQSKMAHKYFSTGQTGFVPIKYVDDIVDYDGNEQKLKKILPQNNDVISREKRLNVLFICYTLSCEKYYVQRPVDKEFNNSLDMSNIWIYGKSGTGKTALITRNLQINEYEFCFCDFSPVKISSSEDVLDEILNNLERRFDLDREINEDNKLKQIVNLLCLLNHQNIIIVIDEFTIQDRIFIDDIITCFTQLARYYRNKTSLMGKESGLRFVISTIANPITSNDATLSGDCFDYICCDDWDKEINELFDLLNISLNLQVIKFKDYIIENSTKSPRVLKYIMRKIYDLEVKNKENIALATQKTLNEIVSNA
jgi:hypothetical protein